MKREDIVKFLGNEYPLDEWKDITLFDNIEDAFVGVAERFGMGPVATYDYNKCIEIYMQDGMTLEEAVEYFNFNVIGLWAGDKTPVFVRFTT
jgi:hypothetical protein|tara:strand:+ start:603 stop:878 length:276 start_codon:yes stop_codon:yes gene_type:complete